MKEGMASQEIQQYRKQCSNYDVRVKKHE